MHEDEATAKQVAQYDKAHNAPAGMVVASQPGSGQIITTAAGTPYYPPALCKTCHEKQYDDWKSSKHAQAIKTLVDGQKVVPECLSCHAEMFRRTQRVNLPYDGIGGVECATCHINSLPHGMERAGVVAKSKVDPKICLDCHTKDRSPDYDEKTYLPMVAHKAAVMGPATASNLSK